jgi:hypothetical protein
MKSAIPELIVIWETKEGYKIAIASELLTVSYLRIFELAGFNFLPPLETNI